MSFLGQHFYTDAGVVLPEKTEINVEEAASVAVLEENLPNLNINNNMSSIIKSDEEKVSTVSVENIDIENMSDEDLKELETSTSNITDDVKVNLQKINKSKSMSKITAETVKKRKKRYSCVLPLNQSNLPVPITFKRRSLNINSGDISRIPVSLKCKKHDASSGIVNNGTVPVMGNKCKKDLGNFSQLTVTSKRTSYFEQLDTKENNDKTANTHGNQNSNNEYVNKNEVKENIPINSIRMNVPIKNTNENAAKVSGLPVLTR